MQRVLQSICVYCGSSHGSLPDYKQTARELGKALATQDIRLVYGGGNVGLMGELADSVLENSGDVIGVIPSKLAEKEVAHTGLTRLEMVETMHERKGRMAQLSDAFLALPGGIGTIEEIFEAYTWTQLGFHNKPCGLLNVAGYFDTLISFLTKMRDSCFLQQEHYDDMIVESDVQTMLEKLDSSRPVSLDKWMKR